MPSTLQSHFDAGFALRPVLLFIAIYCVACGGGGGQVVVTPIATPQVATEEAWKIVQLKESGGAEGLEWAQLSNGGDLTDTTELWMGTGPIAELPTLYPTGRGEVLVTWQAPGTIIAIHMDPKGNPIERWTYELQPGDLDCGKQEIDSIHAVWWVQEDAVLVQISCQSGSASVTGKQMQVCFRADGRFRNAHAGTVIANNAILSPQEFTWSMPFHEQPIVVVDPRVPWEGASRYRQVVGRRDGDIDMGLPPAK